jgi:hypothetical protein
MSKFSSLSHVDRPYAMQAGEVRRLGPIAVLVTSGVAALIVGYSVARAVSSPFQGPVQPVELERPQPDPVPTAPPTVPTAPSTATTVTAAPTEGPTTTQPPITTVPVQAVPPPPGSVTPGDDDADDDADDSDDDDDADDDADDSDDDDSDDDADDDG